MGSRLDKPAKNVGASALLLKELALEDPLSYRNILRLTEVEFKELLELVTPLIEKKYTLMRSSIPCNVKLEITLRYLANGDSLKSLDYLFRVPQNTILSFLQEVFQAIYKVPNTVQQWQAIQNSFEYKWNFPSCCGALDGTHIAIMRPKNSVLSFYNYKGFYSIVLFSMVDADCCFRYIGSAGRASDIFRVSTLNIALKSNLLIWPENGLCVGDDAFPLGTNLLKPLIP